ncbi:MAG: GNAT family N-acetyltransferase [Erysipelothrix sp.]|nr:GNAT family N-acetyltransferase [Erysipelothrix sp.]
MQKDKFEIKMLTSEHLAQFNELLRYVFQITEDDLTSSGYEDEDEIVRAKRPILTKADVIGWFDGDDLISQIAVYPFEANVHGTIFKMGGVTGVGTYPEYANMGLISGLILKALELMRENGQYISYLYPYSVPFYRHKGWEIISDKMSYELKDTQLPKPIEVKGHVERLEIDDPDIYELYENFARSTHGAMLRDELAWDEYWRWENEFDRFAAVYYDEFDKPTGLCFYWISEEVFNVKEMVFLNQEARNGLWNFISAHFSMVETVKGNNFAGDPISFLLEDSDIVETIQPYYMARIVDVKEFLSLYPFDSMSDPIHITVKDSVAEWNNKSFYLEWVDDHVEVSESSEGPGVEMDIGTLSTLMMGYKSVPYLVRIGRISGDMKAMRILSKAVVLDKAYFSDYF